MEHPSYEQGRLAAIAVRLAMSSGLPPADARAALELACDMIDDAMAQKQRAPAGVQVRPEAQTQKSEPCLSSPVRAGAGVGLSGGRNSDVSSSKRL